jgi:hypothetical protein
VVVEVDDDSRSSSVGAPRGDTYIEEKVVSVCEV